MSAAAALHDLCYDHPGSYLRPRHLLEARKNAAAGNITPAALRDIENQVIADLVKKQLGAGMKVVTDGEARRAYFHLDFLKQLGGIAVPPYAPPDPATGKFAPFPLEVVDRVKHVRPIQVDDFLFLRKHAGSAVPKVSIPSPTMAHFRTGRAAISRTAYPDLEDFFDDLVEAYRTEIKELYYAGCRFIQLDDTNLAYLCDVEMRAKVSIRGDDVNTLPDRYAALINACIADRPSDLVIGMHLCRGNFQSQFFASGGYEPVAKIIFQDINVDVLYLEWESDRAGNFEPLRHLVPGRKVVLGLISSKIGALEDKKQIINRIREAASFCPEGVNQLALSTQCGFSSTYHGNAITEQDQWLKLGLIREIAEEVWGTNTVKNP